MAVDPSDGLADMQIRRLRAVAAQAGLSPLDGECPLGPGLFFQGPQGECSVLSVFREPGVGLAYICTGIARDLPHGSRHELLEFCNHQSRDNPMFPVSLYDGDERWDLVVSMRTHIDLLAGVDDYLAFSLAGQHVACGKIRTQLAAVTDSPAYAWDAADRERLLIKSLVG